MTTGPTVISPLTDLQLDALRELANVASGSAATALSQLLAREIDISVPRARALPLAQVVDSYGAPEDPVAGVVIAVRGQAQAIVLLLVGARDADTLNALLGVAPGSDVGRLGTLRDRKRHLRGLSQRAGRDDRPGDAALPPHLATTCSGRSSTR